jgi:hypothetical protein
MAALNAVPEQQLRVPVWQEGEAVFSQDPTAVLAWCAPASAGVSLRESAQLQGVTARLIYEYW